ncbi:MAG: FHA domain-containing protein [Nevskiaceae bacterium]|nr:MAG: FHA domain-containing protein [Nevskiaceae bacterium]
MWQLIVKNSRGQVLREPVSLATGTVNIGRGLECDIVLDSKLVSRLHASLHVDGSQLLFRDEGSANGSAVDGKPVGKTPTRIDAGARIEIADFVIELRRAAAATPSPPSAPDVLEMTAKPVAAAPARPAVPAVQEVAGFRFTAPPPAAQRVEEPVPNTLADSITGLLDKQVRGVQAQRDRYEQNQKSEREQFDQFWREAIIAARQLRDRVGKDPKVLYFVIARDEREVAVKVVEKSRRGHCNLILSRKHPEKETEIDGHAWLGISGEDPQSFRDPRDALAELVRYLAPMLA